MTESISLDKSNFYYSFFNPKIASEVRDNISIFFWYNKMYLAGNEVNNVILNLINELPVEELNPSTLYIKLKSNGMTETEIKPIVDEVSSFYDGDYSFDSSVNIVLSTIRQVVYKSITDQAFLAYKDDPIGFVNKIKQFEYSKIDSGINFDPIGFEDIDNEPTKEDKVVPDFQLRQKELNRAWPAFNAIPMGQLVQVCGAPGSGKSLFMMDLSIQACLAGRKVLYIALGDLKKWTFVIRMNSLLDDIPINDSMLNQIGARNNVANKLGDKFKMNVFPTDEITVERLCEHINKYLNKFDIFVVDYDGNLADSSDSMYEQGEIVYKKLAKYPLVHNKTVIVGSQIKQNYWTWESIDLSAANESSKKQQQVDIMFTIGKYDNPFGVPSGHLRIVKNRNGELVTMKYVRSNSGIFVPVDDVTYASYRDSRMYEHPDTQTIIDQVELNKSDVNNGKPVKSSDAKDFGNLMRNIPDAK